MIRWLVIIVKQPVAGRVKTRLATGIGVTCATTFYRNSSRAVIARLSNDKRWSTTLSVSPDTTLKRPPWPRNLQQIPQGHGDLGARIENAFKALPPGPAILIGSDIPSIRPSHIAEGFSSLGSNDVVFGPAYDGGFWLIGMARRRPILNPFKDVVWSSEHTLADNLRSLYGYRIALVRRLNDIDTAATYQEASSWSGRRVLPIDVR
ncbi:MAG: hypothetical protein TECD_01043 [Hyphomicrobiaceae bacterium hypho_1]